MVWRTVNRLEFHFTYTHLPLRGALKDVAAVVFVVVAVGVLLSKRLPWRLNFFGGGEPLMLATLPPVGVLAAVDVVEGVGVDDKFCVLGVKRFSAKWN